MSHIVEQLPKNVYAAIVGEMVGHVGVGQQRLEDAGAESYDITHSLWRPQDNSTFGAGTETRRVFFVFFAEKKHHPS